MLGHEFWKGEFGGDPSVLGSHIRLNGVEFLVIGVTPESFTGIDLRPALYVPVAMAPRISGENRLHQRDAAWMSIKGRLKPGVTRLQAQGDIAGLVSDWKTLHARQDGEQKVEVETELHLRIERSPATAEMVIMQAVLGLCVLVVACANVAGLLLSQARARQREMAIRLAIGAGRTALVRQLLFESLLLALGGGLLGIVVADAGAAFFSSIPIPTDLPFRITATVDHRVLLFTLVLSVTSTVLFGLAPALGMSRQDLVPALKSTQGGGSGKRSLWGRNTLVAVQVALALVLLVTSAVLVQGFRAELSQGAGFRPEGLFLTSFDTRLARYNDAQGKEFYDKLLRNIRSSPGVRSAALTSGLPMWTLELTSFVPEGYRLPAGAQAFSAFSTHISEGYFSTLGVHILRGREFAETDGENSPPVAVVNDHLANRFWPRGDALGKRIQLSGDAGPPVEIVGIAKAAKCFFITEPPQDVVYLPLRQHAQSSMILVAESDRGDAAGMAPVLREVVRALDPEMPVFDVRTMQDFFDARAVKLPNMLIETVAALGLASLVLALVGLYGLVAYTVSRRTREIGIRVAIGADRRSVLWMVLRQGLWLGGVGVAAGLLVSLVATRVLASSTWFLALTHIQPLIYVVIPLLLLGVTLLATWTPARRAASVDPMQVLRDE